jgi:hypothetical protein
LNLLTFMQIKKDGLDFVEKILTACYNSNKDDLFVMSLMHQYEDRGFLTKGQLQGLFYKAEKVRELPVGLLATLAATLSKLPTREKKDAPIIISEVKKDEETENKLNEILAKYPQHKAVIGMHNNFKKYDKITSTEKLELDRIYKFLLKK